MSSHHDHHHRYSFDSDPGESEPLDNSNKAYSHPQTHTRTGTGTGTGTDTNQPPPKTTHHQSNRRSRNYNHQQQQEQQQQQSNRHAQYPHYSPERSQQQEQRQREREREQEREQDQKRYSQPQLPPSYPVPPIPADTSTSHRRRQSRHDRRNSRDPGRAAAAGLGAGAGVVGVGAIEREGDITAPAPPPHLGNNRQSWAADSRRDSYQGAAAAPPTRPSPGDSVTPGADNFSEAAVGGMPALAYTVAERNPRESGLDAMSGYDNHHPPSPPQQPYPQSYQRSPQPSPYEQPADYGYDYSGGGYDRGGNDPSPPQGYGYGGGHAAAAAAYDAASHSSHSHSLAPGAATPTRSHHSYQSYASDPFGDPHSVYSQRIDPSLGNLHINPNEIDDDGDDGLDYRRPTRNSMLSIGNSSNGGSGSAAAGAAGGAAAAGGVIGGLIGRKRNSQISYNPVANAGPGGGSAYDLSNRAEKPSEWMANKKSNSKRWKWAVIIIVALVIVGAIVGGVVGGIVSQNSRQGDSGHSGQSAEDDAAQNGDLNINSAEIKKLMNNPDLHKVFPGVDYTPINVQYPDCLESPPSQNNITRDVAVLSQLTNTIRLYGTDCNQTEMTIHALNQLELKDEIKIWMGVWQDGNTTTNKRQLDQMWTILDTYGASYFRGVIVANEILFREEMTTTELGTLLDDVRTNLSDHEWDLPVATSDLGDDWTAELAKVSDYIMANIHPFFAGVNAKDAASWTYSFWQNQNSAYFKSDLEKNIISEVGWPTKGGTNCGTDAITDCPNASVAGIDELNQLLDDWVCQALTNGTNYFWFEMFDEPWKISYNTDGKEWEDQWGIMDVNRNLKPGVKIPDCGGKTVS